MTDPLKLAEEIEFSISAQTDFRLSDADLALVAAALRLAEAEIALIDSDDAKPIFPYAGDMTAWSEERDVLIGRHSDAEAAYRAAREGR